MKKMLSALCLTLMFALSPAVCRGETAVASLENGASGAELKMVQSELIRLDYLQDKADGVYGPKTGAALTSWCVDEKINPKEITLLGVLAQIQKEQNSGEGDLTKDPLAVYITQKALERWGFFSSKVDSTYGSKTENALASLEEFAGKDWQDFLADREDTLVRRSVRQARETRRSFDAAQDLNTPEAAEPEQPALLNSDSYAFLLSGYVPLGAEVRSGDNSDDALRAQRRLSTLRYLHPAGADGQFGGNSVRALKYFQRKNGLDETGNCDEATWKALYSEFAEESDQYVSPYMAKVSTSECRVRIYPWTEDGYSKEPVKTFVCTTGAKKTPTVKGTFYAGGPLGSWYYIKKSKVWVQYAFQITGNYLFHSVLFNKKGGKPTSSSVNNLGRNVSHGCVRLSVEDAKWIYNHCQKGMTVVISS